MINEYGVIRATRSLTKDITEGTIGTVLIVYESAPPVYEVEFVDIKGETLSILTVSQKDIMKTGQV